MIVFVLPSVYLLNVNKKSNMTTRISYNRWLKKLELRFPKLWLNGAFSYLLGSVCNKQCNESFEGINTFGQLSIHNHNLKSSYKTPKAKELICLPKLLNFLSIRLTDSCVIITNDQITNMSHCKQNMDIAHYKEMHYTENTFWLFDSC